MVKYKNINNVLSPVQRLDGILADLLSPHKKTRKRAEKSLCTGLNQLTDMVNAEGVDFVVYEEDDIHDTYMHFMHLIQQRDYKNAKKLTQDWLGEIMDGYEPVDEFVPHLPFMDEIKHHAVQYMRFDPDMKRAIREKRIKPIELIVGLWVADWHVSRTPPLEREMMDYEDIFAQQKDALKDAAKAFDKPYDFVRKANRRYILHDGFY